MKGSGIIDGSIKGSKEFRIRFAHDQIRPRTKKVMVDI